MSRVVPGWDLEIGYRPETLPELALLQEHFDGIINMVAIILDLSLQQIIS